MTATNTGFGLLRCFSCGVVLIIALAAAETRDATPLPGFHLTARLWQPLAIPRQRYLEVLEGLCRFSIRHQNEKGAIIDPFLQREHQYATPYFAYAVGTLMTEGQAPDLWEHGIRAMEHATLCFSGGKSGIPESLGEFFMPALTGALALYRKYIPAEQWNNWRERLMKRQEDVVGGNKNNWETYLMKGEWMRVQEGLVARAPAVDVIETAWWERQSKRIAPPPFFFYHDRTSDPDTLSVEAVGRGNLLALIHLGYDGPSAGEIQRVVESATRNTLLLQDPTGQVPANGRTDDHVWVDVGYQLAFEVMAERIHATDPWLGGQFRRAAALSFQSILRWRRTDGEWAGSFFVTKNHFDPALRVGYQVASQYSNYNGALMFHLAEAFHARRSAIAERPAPTEIGGYAVELDHEFATAIANAGGMQVQVNLRGQAKETHGNYWTPLGIIRVARVGWETRLGPSDGALTKDGGVSFAPTFLENGRWLRMADLSRRYEARWEAPFISPALVRASVIWTPKKGETGPEFRQDLMITPDGVLSSASKTTDDDVRWGMTWPLLENDGRPLETVLAARAASTRYPDRHHEQTFIALNNDAELVREEHAFRSTYGDLRPIRVTTAAKVNATFIYPRTLDDPPADAMQASLVRSKDGYRSILGRAEGDIYLGRTAAGGLGSGIDLNDDGIADVKFSATCTFLLQLHGDRITAVEVDRPVTMEYVGRKMKIDAFVPRTLVP